MRCRRRPAELFSVTCAIGCMSPDAHEMRDAEFARLALPLLPAIARVARALTHDESDADDLVQDTFLKAFRHWSTFVAGSDCQRWLSAICRNTFFALRARERWTTAVGDDMDLETLAAVQLHALARDNHVEDMFARLDLAPAMNDAIDALDPPFRDVVRLVDVEDLRYEEAADVLGIPVGTVRSRLYRARRLLQQCQVKFAVDAGFQGAGGPAAATPPQPFGGPHGTS